MTREEFESIKNQTWLNIAMPTDPFVRRSYELVSDAKYLDSPRKAGHIPSRHQVIRYMTVDFDVNASRGSYDRVLVWKGGERGLLPPRDISQAKIAKKIPRSFYQHVFNTIFNLKKGKIV